MVDAVLNGENMTNNVFCRRLVAAVIDFTIFYCGILHKRTCHSVSSFLNPLARKPSVQIFTAFVKKSARPHCQIDGAAFSCFITKKLFKLSSYAILSIE